MSKHKLKDHPNEMGAVIYEEERVALVDQYGSV
jgi:hypothetical protein